MRGKKRVSKGLKDKHVAENRIGNRNADYEDIRIIREIMRKSALSRPSLYIPKETQWHRFARQSEESQK